MIVDVLHGTVGAGLWYGIVAMSAPGVAAQDASYGQVKPFDRSVLLQCFDGILRTRRGETTRRWCERRNILAIKAYRKYQNCGETVGNILNKAFHAQYCVEMKFCSMKRAVLCVKISRRLVEKKSNLF